MTRTGSLRVILLAVGVFALAHAVVVKDFYPRHDNYWTGRAMNSEGGFSKHNADLMYGKEPPDGKWQGWIKVDVTDIPDNATITEASFFYYVVSQSEPAPHTRVTLVGEDPVSSEPGAIWNAIVDGAVASPDLASERGWVERALSADGVQAVQSALTRDWVAFGLCKQDDIEAKGHAKGYQAEKFRPYLRVTFAAADMAIEAILAPAGELASDSVVAPAVSVTNKGDLELPFRLTLTIGDGTNELYRRALDLDAVPAGETREVFFPEWAADRAGGERVVTATIDLVHDADPSDNYAVAWFKVVPKAPEPRVFWGWQEVRPLPSVGAGNPVRAGAWLAVDRATGIIFAARGGKTGDFFCYNPATGLWRALAPVPARLGRGARGATDGKGSVFVIRGGGTQEFWRYSIGENRWERLSDVPRGPGEKKVKNGTDLVQVEQYGLDYIYLLKGTGQGFARYNVQARTWAELPHAPAGASAKWDKGSWLVHDGGTKVFAHKAKVHEMWTHDLAADAWAGQLPAMPYATRSSNYRRKAIKEGGSAVWREGAIYALKSGKTGQFWRFDPEDQAWSEREPLPAFGTTLRPVNVGQGADIVSYPFGRVLYALKGNKTFEFWRYTMPPAEVMNGASGTPGAQSVAGPDVGNRALSVWPNPVAGTVVALRSGAMSAGPATATVFDAAGRVALSRTVTPGRNGEASLDIGVLSAGTYLLRLESAGVSVSRRIVVAR